MRGRRVKFLSLAGCLVFVVAAGWLGRFVDGSVKPTASWSQVADGVYRSAGIPAAYALVDGGRIAVIDPGTLADLQALEKMTDGQIELALLTHHHRDTCAQAADLVRRGVVVRAAKKSAEWLEPSAVRRYWAETVPLRTSRTAYLVVAEGIAALRCDLENGSVIDWHGWKVEVLATPGHSRDHISFLARRGDGPLIAFVGDAIGPEAKMWSPYTTDWDHWTDSGLRAAATSLEQLASRRPDYVCPDHGDVIRQDAVGLLKRAAERVAEVAFLKSYERYTKERVGNPPQYAFLAPEQAGSAGQKPWSHLSPHLFYTGNTYVLVSRASRGERPPILVVDPWGKRSAVQIERLRSQENLGPIEVVMFSHAHYDHYDGVYHLPNRDELTIWSLDLVARPIAEPLYFRAPFLDARPVAFTRRFRDGDTATWGGYRFRFHHFPGQSYFTMAVETEIDGKKCLFTADNFFHVDLYSGTGGWMGLNRSFPGFYAQSARLVERLRPEWVLAEHGGAFEFNAEDFRRRVRWAEAAGRAADAISPRGHRFDWDVHRVHVEPLVVSARPGETIRADLVIHNPLEEPDRMRIRTDRDAVLEPVTVEVEVSAHETQRLRIGLRIRSKVAAGRYAVPLQVRRGDVIDPVDAFVIVDVN